MNTFEAMSALIAGKKLTKSGWGKDYICFENNRFMTVYDKSSNPAFANSYFSDISSEQYIEYVEPELKFEDVVVGFNLMYRHHKCNEYYLYYVVYSDENLFFIKSVVDIAYIQIHKCNFVCYKDLLKRI